MRPNIAVLGAGNMGEALISAAVIAGWQPADIHATSLIAEQCDYIQKTYGVRTTTKAREAVAGAGIVLVAVKPQHVQGALQDVRDVLSPEAVVVSVAAGVTLAQLAAALPSGQPCVRVMPNTPALVGKGASSITLAPQVTPAQAEPVRELLAGAGKVIEVSESDIDAVVAISGSGPAYVFYLIDALAEAGVLLGLPRATALELAVATFEGSAHMVATTGEHPAILREKVSSPGGTTVAALAQLDEAGVRAGMVRAAKAAWARSRDMTKG